MVIVTAQLGIVIQQKDEDIKKATEGIQKILGESEFCEAEKLKLQDQLDSLTIVAENLASLQEQVHLKDVEIERLRNDLEAAREQVQQDHRRPPPDVAENLASLQEQVHLKDVEIERLRNDLEAAREQVQQDHRRPPPDVTHQSLQPDIAAVRQPSAQPDLMPGIGFQVSKIILGRIFNNTAKLFFKVYRVLQ